MSLRCHCEGRRPFEIDRSARPTEEAETMHLSSSLPPRLDGTEIKFVPSASATQRRPDELSLCGFVLSRLATDWKRGLARDDPAGRADL